MRSCRPNSSTSSSSTSATARFTIFGFLVGLTATPDNRTYGFFRKNVVSEYTHEMAVADGVNVGNEVYLIDTQVTGAGGKPR